MLTFMSLKEISRYSDRRLGERQKLSGKIPVFAGNRNLVLRACRHHMSWAPFHFIHGSRIMTKFTIRGHIQKFPE